MLTPCYNFNNNPQPPQSYYRARRKKQDQPGQTGQGNERDEKMKGNEEVESKLPSRFGSFSFNGHFGPINPAKNATFLALEKLFEEISRLFPDEMFHIGGDETGTSCWYLLCVMIC